MEEIIIKIASLVGALTMNKIFDTKMKPLKKKLDTLDENQCKNYLIMFLKSVEKGNKPDDMEVKHAYEVYDHYSKDLGKNSYIHDKWQKLMK